MARHALDGRGVEEIAVVLEPGVEGLARFMDRECEVKLRAFQLDQERLQVETRELPACALIPEQESGGAARIGPPAGSPVIDMIPDIACSLPSKAAVVRSGPVWPNPDTAQ